MEEYRPLAADGAAPEGQTRLPWGDEAPAVAVETPPPVTIEAHPPEPITHFATPEATFFTAEPVNTGTNGHRDADDDGLHDTPDDAPEQPVLEEEVSEEEQPVEGDDGFVPASADDETEWAGWDEDVVDDVWAEDEVWAPASTLDVDDDVWAPPPAIEVAEEPPTPPVPETDEPEEEPTPRAVVGVAEEPRWSAPELEPITAAAPVASDEMEAVLDGLLPSADELEPLEERPPVVDSLPPWTPAPVVDAVPPVVEHDVVIGDPTPVAKTAVDEPIVEQEHVAQEPLAEPGVEERVAEAPVVEQEPVVEEPVAEAPVVEQEPVVEEPVAETPVVEAPRMVSPSHPEWVEQERIVVDDAAPELEWADPEATDFGFSADAPPAPAAEPAVESATPTSAPVAPVGPAVKPQPSEWFNPPEPEPDVAVEAPAAEWLTLPELDEQLAAVSESPPAVDELPPMVGEDEPLAPVASSSAATDFEPPLDQLDETVPLPTVPAAHEATIVDLPVPPTAATLDDEPVVLPSAAAGPTRAVGIRRIAMVAAALVMGTVVVRQLNPSAISGAPTFVGVTSGQASRSPASRADQPATAGSTGGSQHVAAGKTATTVAGGNATTGATAANGSPATSGADGKTSATTTAGAKTTPTTAAAPAATPSSTAGYAAAKKACTDFNRAYVARDNGGMTDDQADDVFVNAAEETYPAYQANPAKWGPMYNHALVLQKQLEGTVDSTDQQIEDEIAAVYNQCKSNGLI